MAAPEAANFPGSLTLGVKEQCALNGAPLAGDQPVSYASDKPKIASVDGNGLVVAHKRGTATIVCFAGDTPVANCVVTVAKAPKKVQFPDKAIVMSRDEWRAYPATLPKGCAGAISYASDNPGVLAVDGAGNLCGVSGGTATLVATTYNGKQATCSVRVLGGPAPTWVSLSQSELYLPAKGTAQLSAAFDEGRDAILTYTTSNKKVATVSENGLVTGLRGGQATITVTTHNGLTATCAVTVYIAPKKVTLNVKKLTMRPNEIYQLVATLTKNSISDIAWESDNPGVASVDGSGVVVSNNVGQAKITATTTNGKRATCTVTVRDESSGGGHGVLFYEEVHDTMTLRIYKDNGIILSYMWLANPNEQLHKVYGTDKPYNLVQWAVNTRGLGDKLVLAFNASPPVTKTYGKAWYGDPTYRGREPSPLMIANGEVLVNDPTVNNKDKYIYWLDAAGQLRHTDRTLDAYTPEERAAVYSDIINSGARNTIIWRPVLVENYQAVPLSKAYLTRTAGSQRKQALCQLDDNTFIVVTGNNKKIRNYNDFQRYLLGLGVRTAFTLDAGGSGVVMYKPGNTPTVKKLLGGGRTLTMMAYFTE